MINLWTFHGYWRLNDAWSYRTQNPHIRAWILSIWWPEKVTFSRIKVKMWKRGKRENYKSVPTYVDECRIPIRWCKSLIGRRNGDPLIFVIQHLIQLKIQDECSEKWRLKIVPCFPCDMILYLKPWGVDSSWIGSHLFCPLASPEQFILKRTFNDDSIKKLPRTDVIISLTKRIKIWRRKIYVSLF